jgi:hypothetical protein
VAQIGCLAYALRMVDVPSGDGDLQRQVDELAQRVSGNRADIDALSKRADDANHRADDANHRADASEARAEVDREMIAELQADGIVSQEHAAQMEEALRSSRKIGAAIGVIMASRQLDEEQAFAVLKAASQNSNRKMRDIADELVSTKGVSDSRSS